MAAHVRISEATHQQLKSYCERTRRTMAGELEYAIKALLNGRISDPAGTKRPPISQIAKKNGRNRH